MKSRLKWETERVLQAADGQYINRFHIGSQWNFKKTGVDAKHLTPVFHTNEYS